LKRSISEVCESFFLWRWLHKFISAAVTGLLMATTGLVFFIVIMRYVFKTNLYGADELVTLVTMWLYFLGAIYGSYEESHIQGDLLNLMFTKRIHYKIHRIYVYTVCVFLMGIWSFWGVQYFGTVIGSARRTTGLKFPFWWQQIPQAIGMWGMLFYSVYHLIVNLFKPVNQYLTREEKAALETPALDLGEEKEAEA